MKPFWKGALAGTGTAAAVILLLAAVGPPESGRYQGLDRDGPIIVVDTETGDIMVQRHDGGFDGFRWAEAWEAR